MSRIGLLLLAGVAIVEGVLIFNLSRQNQQLRDAADKARKSGKPELADKLAKRDAELQVLRVQVQELLKLRHEARALRAGTNEIARLQEENRRLKAASTNSPPESPAPTIVVTTGDAEEFIPKESWTFAGYATPEATLQSWMWSLREGDLNAFLESLGAEGYAKFQSQLQQSNKSEEDLSADLKRQAEGFAGFQILDQNPTADDSITLLVRMPAGDGSPGVNIRHRFLFTRVGNEWKMSDAGVDQ